MKVNVSVTLDIDVDAWMTDYGIERAEVRADVQTWGKHLLIMAASDNGVLKDPA